jgi:hypothetical protein
MERAALYRILGLAPICNLFLARGQVPTVMRRLLDPVVALFRFPILLMEAILLILC